MKSLFALLFAATAALGAHATSTFHLDCDNGLDASSGLTSLTPVRTILRAQTLVRELRATTPRDSPSSPVTVFVKGTCGAARFKGEDGGWDEASRVTYKAAPGAPPPVMSGGVPVPASWLTPVTDPSVLAQLPSDAARAAVRELDLTAHGASIPDAGALVCKPYMGGEASILPGNLMPSGLEFFAPGNPHTGGDFAPLTLARYPNRDHAPKQWSGGNTAEYTITPDAATAARLPLWAQQLAQDPGSVFAHYMGGLNWDDAHHAVANITLPGPAPSPPPPTPGKCGAGNTSCACYESGYDYAGNDLGSPVASPTQASCCALCSSTPGCKFYSFCPNSACAGGPTMCYMKTSNAGRVPWANRLSGPTETPSGPTSASITLSACPSHYAQPGYDALDDNGHYYTYNLLSELDIEGEYYVNRTSGKLYVWLPAGPTSPFWSVAPWSSPVVDGERGVNAVTAAHTAHTLKMTVGDDPIVGMLSINGTLLDLQASNFLTFDGVVVSFGRDVGVRLNGTQGVVFTNGVIENVGNMAVNVTGGGGFALTSSTVRNGGNGAIFLYAGDRPTLTRSNHTVFNSSVSYSNRYMYCYVPMVALADCGNRVLSSELFGGPHQGVFMSGNVHELRNSSLHHLVQGASDSGAVYTGRDFTYQGSVIDSNAFKHINSLDGGDTATLYLDDEVSGYIMTNNYFEDVSRVLELGGGRDNVFSGNVINGTTSNPAITFDNRGEGWNHASCTPPDGEMIRFLARVPYTGPTWAAAFPSLANILADEPCTPKHNSIVGNFYCNLAHGFIDRDNATITSWDSTMWGNVPSCP